MAGDSGSGRRGKLGRAPRAGRGVEGEVGGLLAKQMGGRRAGQRGEAQVGRLGMSSPWRAAAEAVIVWRVSRGREDRWRGRLTAGRGARLGMGLGRVCTWPAASARPGAEQGRERESRERKRFDRVKNSIFLKIFHIKSKNFEYESCSKFKILQLSFHA